MTSYLGMGSYLEWSEDEKIQFLTKELQVGCVDGAARVEVCAGRNGGVPYGPTPARSCGILAMTLGFRALQPKQCMSSRTLVSAHRQPGKEWATMFNVLHTRFLSELRQQPLRKSKTLLSPRGRSILPWLDGHAPCCPAPWQRHLAALRCTGNPTSPSCTHHVQCRVCNTC